MNTTIPKIAAYGAGIMYPKITDSLTTTLRASGIETLILWGFHISIDADIGFNNIPKLIVFDKNTKTSGYVGEQNWPTQLQAQIGSGSTITQIAASFGGWDCADFYMIDKFYNENNKSFDNTALKSNFELFKSKFPMITLIDMDIEDNPNQTPIAYKNFHQESFVAFCRMLNEMGFGITFCPYSMGEIDFWTGSLNELNKSNPGAVRWWNLQCYAGGWGNNVDNWAGKISSAIPGFKTDGYILVSDGSRSYDKSTARWSGDCTQAFQDYLKKNYFGKKAVGGGFLWTIDAVQEYAETSKKFPDDAPCNNSKLKLTDYIAAITNGLFGSGSV